GLDPTHHFSLLAGGRALTAHAFPWVRRARSFMCSGSVVDVHSTTFTRRRSLDGVHSTARTGRRSTEDTHATTLTRRCSTSLDFTRRRSAADAPSETRSRRRSTRTRTRRRAPVRRTQGSSGYGPGATEASSMKSSKGDGST